MYTVKTGIIESWAMSLGIPYVGKGVKKTAGKRATQPLCETNKKTPDHTIGGDYGYIAHDSIIPVLL